MRYSHEYINTYVENCQVEQKKKKNASKLWNVYKKICASSCLTTILGRNFWLVSTKSIILLIFCEFSFVDCFVLIRSLRPTSDPYDSFHSLMLTVLGSITPHPSTTLTPSPAGEGINKKEATGFVVSFLLIYHSALG